MEELNNIKLFLKTSISLCEEEKASNLVKREEAFKEQKEVAAESREYYRLEGSIEYFKDEINKFTSRIFAYKATLDAVENEINSVESYIDSLLPSNSAETYGLMPWEA